MNKSQETTVFHGHQKLTSAMKFDALYRYVSIESILKSGGVKKKPEVCIGGCSSVCQPYMESATAFSDY